MTYPEHRESLWALIVAPSIWALHFVLSYASASVWCAKAGDASASLGGVRTAIAMYTAMALVGIAVTGVVGFRRHGPDRGLEATGHDFDSPEGRHRFLGFAMMLLAGLSAVATIFTALPVVFIDTCR